MPGDDKSRPDFSDVRSGGSSTAPEPAPQRRNTDEFYVVVAGDSLSKIAKHFYGDANRWRQIHEANRDRIPDPDVIHPGQRLRIPR